MNKKVVKELASLFSDGFPEPEAIVKHARKSKGMLHAEFDWNDKVAADKWRRFQAITLLDHWRWYKLRRGIAHN